MTQHKHHHSLANDIEAMLNMAASRRQSLRWLFAGAAAAPLASCGGGGSATAAADTTATTGTSVTSPTTGTGAGAGSTGDTGSVTSGGSCSVIPEETGGPYPGDGTNSTASGVANAMILAGIVRSDIRASVAGPTGVAEGTPLTVKLQLVNVKAGCASLAGATVYLWHCDRNGDYSMYSAAISGQNYLRGVQEADSSGVVTFNTIFPGCYAGRMPHIHFEVYPSLAKATNAANRIKTSQLGFPAAMLAEAYTATGYSTSVRNLAQISYATDNVFSDGTALQIAALTGSVAQGYVATLTVGVSL